jgi:ADP-ribose pyrophosphatase YjhB (NUDIX family)
MTDVEPLSLPWVRIGAYAIITHPDDPGTILLCRIAPGYPGAGTWTLPGGGVDHGEHPDAGVVREVAEETGLAAVLGPVAGIASGFIERPVSRPGPLHWVAILYHARVSAAELRQEVGGSTEVCAWIAITEVVGLPRVGLVDQALAALTGRD